MRNWIRFPRVEGTSSRQAHCDLPEGTFERELGREGFFGPSTQMYHRHQPTGWSAWEGPLRPRAFNLNRLEASSASPWEAHRVMGNAGMQLRWWRCAATMKDLVRNADGDELIFIHEGAGELFCDYGHLALRDGDYVVLPRGTAWRIETAAPLTALLVEATGDSYQLPDKGILGNQAIFDPAVLDTPRIDDAFLAQQDERPWKVVVKRRDRLSTVSYPFNPLDAIGWHGDLAPVRLNWRDLRPIVSARYHVPPSAHVNFVAERFAIGTFAPRPIESDPGALKVPFFHNDDDVDEIIFLHRGQFFSRDNFGPGMLSLHPCGFPHGPQPKAFAIGARRARTETDEVAVYIDTFDAVEMTELPAGVEDPSYVDAWKAPAQ
ncbi:MAG TPA: homogentisate 1,2-dioxygenase [Candidatus Binataceae bacterium]|jgi:homogentisate 1,2-dioxygenase|nr:homogentisate 1,2-dioxygenase [Candidatus Binataceae bacterium]